MKYTFLLLLIVIVVVVSSSSSSSSSTCRFAKQYDSESLLNNESTRRSFLNDVLYWEGNFHQDGAGINVLTGYTYDGHTLDYSSGELTNPLHNFSAPSKESIHLGMAALAVLGVNEHGNDPLDFFHVAITQTPTEQQLFPPQLLSANLVNLFTILYRKINTYETFNKNYPGYGGYMPWVTVSDEGVWPIEGYWTGRVPGLDNGEMIWGMVGLVRALNQTAELSASPSSYTYLAQRYQAYIELLKSTAKWVFYTQEGYINAVTRIGNITAQPTAENYKNDCDCYLDDPYEGELLTFFMDLYCEWDSDAERDQLWINKRNLLQNSTLVTPMGDITVQRGWWFSSHEQWKYLMLPYQDVEINQRVFINGERARTWFSYMNKYPGLFASVNNVTTFPNLDPNYLGATGIQEIAFQESQSNDVVTPYGSFPLFLVAELDNIVGLQWYFNMISGPSMQNVYGSTESVDIHGTMISPIITWDSKITTLLSMMGGVVDLNRQTLIQDGVLERFLYVVNREWSLKFNDLQGESLPFMIPQSTIPHVLQDFSSCN